MEFDAADPFIFAIVTAQIGSRLHGSRIHFATGRRFGITKHLEVILENIDDFVGLQGCLDLKSNSINELIKFLLRNLGFLKVLLRDILLLFLFFLLKISWIVHGRLVN